jgi:hypothetical protein
MEIRNEGASAILIEENDELHIDFIYARIKKRGFGSELMQRICDFADVQEKHITLLPVANSGMPLKKLHAWYERFGFEDFESGMIRKNRARIEG